MKIAVIAFYRVMNRKFVINCSIHSYSDTKNILYIYKYIIYIM